MSKGDNGRINAACVKGDKGEPGPPGPPGSRGAKGERGRKGENGTSVAVPKILVALEDQTIVAKRSAKFVCLASGYPVPEIQFHMHNRTMDERYKRHGEGVLVIRSVKYEDEGDITCTAKSILGEDSSTATLTVHGNFLLFFMSNGHLLFVTYIQISFASSFSPFHTRIFAYYRAFGSVVDTRGARGSSYPSIDVKNNTVVGLGGPRCPGQFAPTPNKLPCVRHCFGVSVTS